MSAADDRDEVEAKDGAVPAGVTDQAGGAARTAAPQPEPRKDLPGRDWPQWIWKRNWILLLLLLSSTIPVGLTQGAAAVVLVLVALALVLVISLFWASVRTLLGETPLSGADAYALAAPRAEEEQKQAILRALQDLKYERSVGKISEEDYAALESRYRAEAKRLLRSLDEEAKPRRDRVESLVHQRLAQAGLESAAPGTPAPEAAAEAKADAKKGKKKKAKPVTGAVAPRTVEIIPIEAKVDVEVTRKSQSPSTAKTQESPAYVPPSKTCRECSTKNDPDAVFCKKCGSKSFSDGERNGKPVQVETKTDDAEAPESDGDQAAETESDEAAAMETRR